MDNTMGLRISQLRLDAGMTMEDLAKKLGVGKSAVNKWEKGHVTNIKRPTIEKMAQVFGCSPSYLLGYSDKRMTLHISTPNRDDMPKLKAFAIPDRKIDGYTQEEIDIIFKYRNADSDTKNVIKRLLAIKERL